MHVQYGCGFTAPDGWLNFDASMTLRWERTPLIGRLYTKNARRFPANVQVGDIVKGLPVADGSSQGIYASHVLEHLALEDFHKALDNTRRLLAPGGIFRLVVPDLQWAAREYVKKLDARDSAANAFFLGETHLGERRKERGLAAFVYQFLNTSRHLWMWDEPGLRTALVDHGFGQIRRCEFGDCEDPMFSLVEEEGRFEHSVAMEARNSAKVKA